MGKNVGHSIQTRLCTVPKDSDIGNQIANAKVGVAFHTDYSWDGEDPKTLKVFQVRCKENTIQATQRRVLD